MRRLLAAAVLAISLVQPASAGAGEPRFEAVAFDYFVIFDPNSSRDC